MLTCCVCVRLQVALGAGMVAATAYALNRLLKPYVISAYDR